MASTEDRQDRQERQGRQDGLVGRSATEIAALVRAGEADPVDVLTAHLDRITALDPALGAFQAQCRGPAFESARELGRRGDLADLALAGVPVAIKDGIDVEGLPTRRGSLATSERPAAADDELVRRLRAAGAVIVGKTRVPELMIWPFTESLAWGTTRNPWDVAVGSGGSSGGSSAAVAAGLVPLALGSDGLGSIRIPAAVCGLIGVKPGTGTVPWAGGVPHWHGMSEQGPLATTVGDAALALDVLAGRDDLRDPVEPAPGLRIAVSFARPLAGVPLTDECRAATVDAVSSLRTAGHVVAEADPPYGPDLALRLTRRWVQGVAEDAAGLRTQLLEPRTRTKVRLGRLVGRTAPVPPDEGEDLRTRFDAWFVHHDVLLTPTLARPGLPVGSLHNAGWLRTATVSAMFAPFPGVWNAVGYPALSVPAGRTRQGLPLGVQLVAPRGHEGTLLSVAAQLERLRPWPRTAPIG